MAIITTLYNTGVGDNHLPLPISSQDKHYKLISSPNPPIVAWNPIWIPNSDSPLSMWISPAECPGTAGCPEGDYVWETTFDLSEFNYKTAIITGKYACDNLMISIELNNTVIVPVFSPYPDSNHFTDFQLNKGFIPGINTIRFTVRKYPTTEPFYYKYIGLRVEMNGIADLPKIPFIDSVLLSSESDDCIKDLEQTLEVQNEVKLFSRKYMNTEAQCFDPPRKATTGDNLVFTLVYGNYGELPYNAIPGVSTVEDVLYIDSPMTLTLKSLCVGQHPFRKFGSGFEIPLNYRLFNVTDDKEVQVCDKFDGGKKYILRVEQQSTPFIFPQQWTPFFGIECHTINCISMLFEIGFKPCGPCK